MNSASPHENEAGPRHWPPEFHREVNINGLSFTFEGNTPQELRPFARFVWTVSIPSWDDEDLTSWSDEIPYSKFLLQDLRALNLGNGNVGIIEASIYESEAGPPAIWLGGIQTATRSSIVRGHEYYDADGVGSFLLDELCQLADDYGLKLSLTAHERRLSRLDQGQIHDWYQSRGFEDGVGEMIRHPQRTN